MRFLRSGSLTPGSQRPKTTESAQSMGRAAEAQKIIKTRVERPVLCSTGKLHRVLADLLSFPGADVANLPVRVVVPTLSGNRIGNRLTQFV